MTRYRIRFALKDDLAGVQRLAQMLNTVNLPNKSNQLLETLEKSENSFKGLIVAPLEREYLFILEDLASGLVIGTSQIIAQHGTKQAPHAFFDVSTVEHYSKTVDKLFKHQVLRLGFNYDGPTEVGGLILDPEYRGNSEKLGKQLSFIRFMLIAMNPEFFKSRLLAESLPPFNQSGESLLWEALGSRFTHLDYIEADHISRSNKEFIKNLFPPGQIYTTLFDEQTKKEIGEVGKASKGASKLLTQIGFTYQNRVDPFDGGPHFEANTKDVSIINKTKSYKLSHSPEQDLFGIVKQKGLVALWKNPFTVDAKFYAAQLEFYLIESENRILIDEEAIKLLKAEIGDQVFVLVC